MKIVTNKWTTHLAFHKNHLRVSEKCEKQNPEYYASDAVYEGRFAYENQQARQGFSYDGASVAQSYGIVHRILFMSRPELQIMITVSFNKFIIFYY